MGESFSIWGNGDRGNGSPELNGEAEEWGTKYNLKMGNL